MKTELIPGGLTLACASNPHLFDSTSRVEHVQARQDCVACPALRGCLDLALDPAVNATGTFGGQLFVRGVQVTP